MENANKFNKYDAQSIENYAKKLIGLTFNDVIKMNNTPFKKIGGKGRLGQIIEKHYFGYGLNSNAKADFEEAGIELKVTGYKKLKKTGLPSPKERLVLNIINFFDICNETFESSALMKKNKKILFVFYEYDDKLKNNKLDFKINYVKLFEIPKKDLIQVKNDWETIQSKIKSGNAHKLSEKDTLWLGACTKGASKKSVRNQPFSDKQAMQRAFSFKTKYMKHILNTHVLN